LPVFRIDANYATRVEQLPTPGDKAAALEAALTAELSEDDSAGFTYRQLGERLQRLKERKDATDEAAQQRLRALEEIAQEVVETQSEPERLRLTEPGEYGLFTVLRTYSTSTDETYVAECAKRMVAHLRANNLLAHGWSNSKGARMRVEGSLLAESWNQPYAGLGFNPDDPVPSFLAHAVEELALSDVS
jgi:type I restriction enzyme R subunit